MATIETDRPRTETLRTPTRNQDETKLTRDEPGDALMAVWRAAPDLSLSQRTYQYSSMVRKSQARPTIPGGTVEWKRGVRDA